MSRNDGVGQIIKACITVVTLVALTGGFRVITAALDDVCGVTRGAGDTVLASVMRVPSDNTAPHRSDS